VVISGKDARQIGGDERVTIIQQLLICQSGAIMVTVSTISQSVPGPGIYEYFIH
jgi:hypothetical protein